MKKWVSCLIHNGTNRAHWEALRAALRDNQIRLQNVSPDHHLSAPSALNGGLLIPGGEVGKLRRYDAVRQLIRVYMEAKRPVGAIGRGVQLLRDARVVAGRRLTSHPDLRLALTRDGALWEDEVVLTDGHLVTCRQDGDIPAFVDAFLRVLHHGPVEIDVVAINVRAKPTPLLPQGLPPVQIHDEDGTLGNGPLPGDLS